MLDGSLLLLARSRYLVPADLTVGQFVYVIRKRIKLSAEKAIFIFVDNVLPPTGQLSEREREDNTIISIFYIMYRCRLNIVCSERERERREREMGFFW